MKIAGKTESEITLSTLVEFFARNAWVFAVFFVCTAAFTIWKFRENPAHTAVSTIILESSQSNAVQAVAEKLAGGQSMGMMDEGFLVEKYLVLMGSRSFAESAARILTDNGKVKRFLELMEREDVSPENADELTSVFLGAFEAGRVGNDIIRISVVHSDPGHAVELVNLTAQTLVEAMSDRNASDIKMARTFLMEELNGVERRLKELDARIAREQLSIRASQYELGGAMSNTPGEAANMDRENIELNRDLLETEEMIANLKKEGENVSGSAIDKYGAQAALATLEAKAKLQRMRIAANRKMLSKVLVASRQSPASNGEVDSLFKKREVEYLLFAELKKEVMSLDIQHISAQNKVRILERAIPGSARAARNLIKTVLKRGLVAVVVAGLLALFIENYDPVVRSAHDVMNLRLIYLGCVPSFSKRRHRWMQELLARIPFLRQRRANHMHNINIEPDSLQDIVFKNLRVRVNGLLNQGVLKPRVVSVMSASSGEGKTSLSSNLAKYLAMSGRRVLLIDADLRRRSLSASLGHANSKGVSEYLLDPKASHTVPLVRKIADHLDFLPAGKYSVISSELMNGETFHELLEAMKHYYDFVILDTPPALPYSEVVPIAAASDLVMFTVLSRQTTIRCVEQTIEKLRFGVSTPIGLVLNRHDDRTLLMYSQYYVDAPGGSKPRAA